MIDYLLKYIELLCTKGAKHRNKKVNAIRIKQLIRK